MDILIKSGGNNSGTQEKSTRLKIENQQQRV